MTEKRSTKLFINLKVWWPLLVLLLAVCLLFHFFGNAARGYIKTDSIFVWWIKQWLPGGGDSQHGFLILALSIWIFKSNLDEAKKGSGLGRVVKADIYWGVGIMLLALFVHLIGFLVQQTRFSILAFLIFIMGLARLGFGRKAMMAAVFPLLFMIFSMPLGFLSDEIGYHLRAGVIKLAQGTAELMGIDVIRNGTQLLSASDNYTYDVAPACSGIRSLVALTALSLLIGYLYFRSWWRRILLFLLSFPFAFVGNVLRILCIILAAEWIGQAAGNFVHEWFGFIIFGLVIGLSLATVALLNRFLPEKKTHPNSDSDGDVEGLDPAAHYRALLVCVLGMLLFILVSGFCVYKMDHATYRYLSGLQLTPDEKEPVELPDFLGFDWSGQAAEVSEIERDYLPDDTGFSRKLYVNLENPSDNVYLSIVLSGRDRSSIHRPEICLVAQGWTIKGRMVHDFSISENGTHQLRATVLRIEKDIKIPETGKTVRVKSLYGYWFVAGDGMVHSHRSRMVKMTFDRLFRFRNHRWAYVTVQTVVRGGNESTALHNIEEVLQQTVPEFVEPELLNPGNH